ncbi:alpha/beta hydrolase [Halioxenophilus sp. WMMB6]|uniref:alpha/beta fold hydrolase n=1 Tax=Halioxenophilus sp. WMMB6 TaxID=3073815 RepID=UPI00295F2863|nr:alpha/beta hydrolase [Halioxenophilus sp. WMMB6]
MVKNLILPVRSGVDLEVEVFGEELDKTVVLVAGINAPAQFWPTEFCRKLADFGYKVVRYSNRDVGLSTTFKSAYPFGELVSDLIALLDYLALKPVKLIGHSMGGFITQVVACDYPEYLSSAVIISASCTIEGEQLQRLGVPERDMAQVRELMNHTPSGNFEQDLPGWLEHWALLNGSHSVDRELATGYTRALYVGGRRAKESTFNQLYAYTTVPKTLVDQVRMLKIPCLIMHGTEDPLMNVANGYALNKLISNSQIATLTGAGHMFMNNQLWSEILENIVEFYKKIKQTN